MKTSLPSAAVKTFFLFFLLSKQSICSVRESKLNEFGRKLQQKTDSIAATDSPKSVGGVFYPIGYGADPTGAHDSAAAIMAAVKDATSRNFGKMLPGITDCGGAVIDLQGGSFLISSPIGFPAGTGNVVVQGGTIRASNTFPGNRHLVELWSLAPQKLSTSNNDSDSDTNFFVMKDRNNDGMQYEDITFRDILFDSSYRGGGLYIVDSIRIRILDSFFLRFTTQGVLVVRGHETLISTSFLGQHPTDGGDPAEKSYTGIGIDISSTDNAITDVVVFSAWIGIRLRGNANIVTGVHCYNKARGFGGVGIAITSAQNRIVSPYLDYNSIEISDPDQVIVSNGFFLGDGNVVLRSANQARVSGLTIVDNMFCGRGGTNVAAVEISGVFKSVDQVVVDRNVVANGMGLRSTVAKKAVAGNGMKWVVDFSGVLLFGNKINHLDYSVYYKNGGGFVKHGVTKVSKNMVVVESDETVDAVVSVSVDQYNFVGEKSLYN